MKPIQHALLAAAIVSIIGCDSSKTTTTASDSASNDSTSTAVATDNDDTSTDDADENESTPEQPVTEVKLLGSNWRYESWISPCPYERAVFESTQFLSSDGLTINSYSRNDGEIVSSISCNHVTVSNHPAFSVASANATDPIDKEELRAILTDWTSFYYGAPESNIDIDLETLTEDELVYQATISGYGYSFNENVTLTRIEE